MNVNIKNVYAAQSGFNVVSPLHDFDTVGRPVVDYVLEPVIGWALGSVGETYPITLEGVQEQNTNAILRPDGVVDHPFREQWGSINDWLKSQNAEGLV